MLSSNFSFFLREVMRPEEYVLSLNAGITVEKSSLPNLQQGACLAEEVGDVGGETSGSARERAGFAPDKSLPPQSALLLRAGGMGAACTHVCIFSYTKPNQ
jgi:hypothetical protein